jgi:hypothetical protein
MKSKGPFHFRCIQTGQASAMVLYMNLRDLEKHLGNGNRFVHLLWTKGTMLRRKSTFEPSFNITDVDWTATRTRIEFVIQHMKVQMMNLNEIIQNASVFTVDTGSQLLRNVLEIGVNTYLRCAVGYIPRQLSLAELIDWTGVVGRRIVDFIYPSNPIEVARMRCVLDIENIWAYDKLSGLENTSGAYYQQKADELVHFFKELYDELFEEIEQKMEQEKGEVLS